ncbi:hypothetical protein P8A22_18890 [Streptomyces laculatispora]|uniref:Uncharacterized protein n=1 Tax=Streptomyces laculatispora TaxID=887464 RepID=A0ABY9I5J1_9ACTN|nr:hypothetical protein [Streptomyces laculatispora]WLQ41854.1 hypothetical protein P8A22_18890 [Streptomyces laculatispora]
MDWNLSERSAPFKFAWPAGHRGDRRRVREEPGAQRSAYSGVRRFARAVAAGTACAVEYVATWGNRTARALSRLVPAPPCLYARCHLGDDERDFAVSGLHGVLPG